MPFPLFPGPAPTEPRCRGLRFSAFAPNRPTYVPVSERASCAHLVRGTGNLRAAGAPGAWRTRGRPARRSREPATRAGTGRPPRDRRARRLAVPPPRAASGVAVGGARGEKPPAVDRIRFSESDARPPWPFRALPARDGTRVVLGFEDQSRISGVLLAPFRLSRFRRCRSNRH